MVRMVVVMLSLFAAGCLLMRHRYKSAWKTRYYNHDNLTYAYYGYQNSIGNLNPNDLYTPEKSESMISVSLFFELMLLLTCPIPFYDVYIPHIAKKQI